MSLRLPPEEYEALCQNILERDGYKCRHCGYRQELHVHHIVYRSDNGPDESWNLVVLCRACHDGVHDFKLFIWSDDQSVGADGPLEFNTVDGWKPQ